MLNNLHITNGKWVVDGVVKPCWLGRGSFKLANMLSMHYAGLEGGWLDMASRWIEHNQRLLGENVILRVFGETGGWGGPGHPSGRRDHPMFGSRPYDAGIWDLEDIQTRSAEGRRIENLTFLNKNVIARLMKFSHETGCAFEYVVDATLKHTVGLGTPGNEWLKTPITDHAIRQTASYMRDQMETFPKAKIILEARNEWTAHNKMGTGLDGVNMWAARFYRWAKEDDGEKRFAFSSPGANWSAEQWPEGYIVVDRSLGNGVSVGTEPGRFQMGLLHPDRDPEDGKWWHLPTNMDQLRADCRGTPLGFNESKLYVDSADAGRASEWYRGVSYTTRLDKYLDWVDNCLGTVDYFIIHDEKGMQCDPDWPRRETRLEAELRGTLVPPLVDFRPIISQAYFEILDRRADEGGLDHKNAQMQAGMTEAKMREIMIRSPEYARRYPI